MHKFFKFIVDFFFLTECLSCSNLSYNQICQGCLNLIEFNLKKQQQTHLCLYYLADYKESLKYVLHDIKFFNNTDFIHWIINNISLINYDFLNQYDYWTIVPYHSNRINQRGFSLVTDLFQSIFEKYQIPFISLFERCRDTDPLYDKSVDE